MNPSKEERFVEYLRRLNEAPAASCLNEALALIGDTLNAVEDEMTDIAFDPDRWQTDGRMYPPQADSLRDVAGRDHVKRFRSRGHNTFVRDNGAFEIQAITGAMVFRKNGANGLGVWDP
jgi:hypothetical protein